MRWTYDSVSSGSSMFTTHETSGTSMPREAMSVATSTRTSPRRKPSSARVRWPCVLSEWIAAQATPVRESFFTTRSAPWRIFVKTMTLFHSGCCSRRCARSASFWLFATNITFWLIFSTVGVSGEIVTDAGSWTSSPASLRTGGGIVAEKKSDWRDFGSFEIMRLMSGRKPMSSMRSASSRTKHSTWSR